MKWKLTVKPVAACMLGIWLSMVTGVGTGTAAPERQQPAPTRIQAVQLRGDGAAAELLITASAPTTYTSYKSTAPARLVIDFSQTAPADALNSLSINKGPVKAVTLKRFDTDAGVLTRMELFLSQDIDPVISPSAERVGELLVSFPGYVEPSAAIKQEVAAAPTAAEPVVAPVVASEAAPVEAAVKQEPADSAQPEGLPALVTGLKPLGDGVAISTNRPVSDYKTFRLSKPDRVVIDIQHAQIGMADKMVLLNSAGVSTARIGSYPDKVRIVFDAINGSLDDAVITRSATGLHVAFSTQQPVRRQVTAAAPQEQATASAAKAAPVQAAVPQAQKPAVVAQAPAAVAPKPVKSAEALAGAAQVSAVDFQVVGEISRVMVKVNGSPVVEQPVKLPGSVAYRIRNVQLPRNLQRSLEAREFVSPVLRITPVVIRTKAGSDVLVRVTMKKDAAFDFRQESDILYLDFKHPADMTAAAAEPQKATAAQKAAPVAAEPAREEQMLQEAQQQTGAGVKRMYSGRKVTLEFADAEVRKIFQLLSEVSNKNFVLGDEVTGNISLKLVNVPWDQALDIILDTKGLDKREEGNIVLIRGKGKFKSLMDEEVENRKAALKGEPLETAMFDVNYADLGSIVTQFTALKTDRGMISQDQRTNKVIVKDVKAAIDDMRTILKSLDIQEKQVMIEARIVEASSTFTQTLGINWGIHYRDGSASIAGINAFDTSFGGLASNAAPASGVSGNPGATAGISFGTLSSNIKLDMRLNAAVSAGLVRIVSTPRVATLNHKSAKITQGQQIPYTSSTSDKVETKFVEAALALEVTPHINPNGTIIMKIDAKNDSPGSTGSPPPINKKQATTEMMLRDGETTVIGGIYVERESGGEDGVPFLKDVPWLGNLFKSTDTKRSKDELLIFITPRIITSTI